MKITNVRAVQPIAENSPPDWRTSIGQILVAVDTDKGLTGYGVGGGGKAGIHVIETVLRDVLIDRDPRNIDLLWNDMYRATLAFGRKGIAIMAISGVDLALWDLRGKAEGVPVARLLGGDIARAVPVYCTVWDQVPDDLVGRFPAYKLHIHPEPDTSLVDTITEAVGAAREKIGPAPGLMVDAWMEWDVLSTMHIAERITPFRVDWIEEPLSPDDLPGYLGLREQCPIPIAGGEHEFTAVGFAPLIGQRLHSILQPDVCWCGGMTELVKIYRMAADAGLRVCPHRGAEVWGLHAIVALDEQPLAESGRPWMTWVGGQPEIINGRIALYDRPGFGVTIDEDRLPGV